MNESKLTTTINWLLAFAMGFTIHGTAMIFDRDESRTKAIATKSEILVPELTAKEEKPNFRPYLWNAKTHFEVVLTVSTTVEYEYVGSCFITAYCPAECVYNGENFPKGWSTSSGTICHYEDEWNVPTTCAIDTRYFSYGDVLCVGDGSDRKYYVCEDTGAFSGMWIDCFVESMDEVRTWESNWRPVYKVSTKTQVYSIRKETLFYERFTNHLSSWGNGNRIPYRNDC